MDVFIPTKEKEKFITEKRKTKYSVKIGIPKITKKKYSKSGHFGGATATGPRVYEPLIYSPHECHGDARLFSPCSYDIIFSVDLAEPVEEEGGISWAPLKWYTINIHANGPGKVYPEPIVPFWKGKVPALSGLATLGSHIYSFGGMRYTGLQALRDVFRLQVTPDVGNEFVPVSPMLSPRSCSEASVLGTKIFVRIEEFQKSSYPHHWGEIFDPANGRWEALPNPPNYPPDYQERIIISAALENPERIIVAFREPGDRFSAIFYAYNVQDSSWGMLAPAKRKLHRMCSEDWLGRGVSVGNCLYWIERDDEKKFLKDDILVIAYDLGLDQWLEGRLKGHGMGGGEGRPPAFLHLEKQRFCLLQYADDDYVRCVVVDVSQMPQGKTLTISVVWDQNYAMEPPICPGLTNTIVYCDKMHKKMDLEEKSSKKEVA